MSYVPSHRIGGSEALAQPNALIYLPSTTQTSYYNPSVTTGGYPTPSKVPLGSPTVWYGSWTPSISNDVITLPSGYFYFIETAVQVYYALQETNTSVYPTGSQFYEIQVYDETNSQYIGNMGKAVYWDLGRKVDNNRDNAAFALIDCSSSGINVSMKVKSNNSSANDKKIWGLNYQDPTGYAGQGRTIIWRLDP